MPDGPGRFAQDFSCPALLRIPLSLVCVHVRDYHPLRWNFPEPSIPHSSTTTWSYNPKIALLQLWFGLFPGRSPLLGESLLFSLPGGTKMFQFPPFASIRKSRDQRLFASTPSLSQLITSFIASVSLGIRHTPFLTFAND